MEQPQRARVLIADRLAPTAVEVIRGAGHDVIDGAGLHRDKLLTTVADADAVIVRSATTVDDELLAAGGRLSIVARAGSGVDNVDLSAATKRGVIVLNTPGANSMSMAEHAIGMLLSLARNIPQASAALRAGRWERSRWQGVELDGHTLGILGLGPTGSLVAERAHALGMHLIGWDPWMNPDRAAQLGVELRDLDDLIATADFVTVHVQKTKDTEGLIDARLLAKAKPTMRLVNCARGGIVVETDLAQALRDGTIAGAALDVFQSEPTTDSPLFDLDGFIGTPHLAASTEQAQERAGIVACEQVCVALAGGLPSFAINLPAKAPAEDIAPFTGVVERLGLLVATMAGSFAQPITLEFEGDLLVGGDTSALALAALKGMLGPVSDEPVTYVNAREIAANRGVELRTLGRVEEPDHDGLIRLRIGDRSAAVTLAGRTRKPRLVEVDDFSVEVPLERHLLLVRNDDRVGMMAQVTAIVAEAGINIADMRLSRDRGSDTALAVILTDTTPDRDTVQRLRDQPGITSAQAIQLDS